MSEKKSCGGDISNKDPAGSDDTDVFGECKESVLRQIDVTVLEAEFPSHHKSTSRVPALGNTGSSNSSEDVGQRKPVASCDWNTGTFEVEGGDGDYRIRANETVEEYVPTKGDDVFDTRLPKSRTGKLKHLLVLKCK